MTETDFEILCFMQMSGVWMIHLGMFELSQSSENNVDNNIREALLIVLSRNCMYSHDSCHFWVVSSCLNALNVSCSG